MTMTQTRLVPQLDSAGLYLGPAEADPSPLDGPGVWLIPAGCVDLPLPTIPPGHQARLVGREWVFEPTGAPTAPLPVSGDVPAVVTMRQACLALHAAGLLDDVDAAIAALPEAQRRPAEIEWQRATTIERSSPLTALIAAALQLSEQHLDELFATAATL